MQTTTSNKQKSRQALRPFLPAWLRELLPKLKGAPLSVYVAHLTHADRDGKSWPSLELLEKETGFERRSIQRAREELIRLKLMRREKKKQRRLGGRFERNVFVMTVPVDTVVPKCPTVRPTVVHSTAVGGCDLEGNPSLRETKKKKKETHSTTPRKGFENKIPAGPAWAALGVILPLGSREFVAFVADRFSETASTESFGKSAWGEWWATVRAQWDASDFRPLPPVLLKKIKRLVDESEYEFGADLPKLVAPD